MRLSTPKRTRATILLAALVFTGCLASTRPAVTEEDHRAYPMDQACASAHAEWRECRAKCSDTFFLFRPSCLSCDNRLAMVCSRGSGLGN